LVVEDTGGCKNMKEGGLCLIFPEKSVPRQEFPVTNNGILSDKGSGQKS